MVWLVEDVDNVGDPVSRPSSKAAEGELVEGVALDSSAWGWAAALGAIGVTDGATLRLDGDGKTARSATGATDVTDGEVETVPAATDAADGSTVASRGVGTV